MLEAFRRKRRNRMIVEAIWDQVVLRARRPVRFEEGGLPDTVMGRFESLAIEVFLLLRRCGKDPALADLSQDLVDRFMTDLDHSLREIGIGYLAVPKRMRALAARFYQRVGAMEGPLSTGDRTALAAALRAGAFTDAPGGRPDAADDLAHHIFADAAWYDTLPTDRLLAGRLDPNTEPTLHESP
ncbi:ubiquinol-cytochrome C chaperone family protein [Aureimonas ureilytica]|uniref:ubiquinol-cytochrome C chaperone family protein n=1 Tax=Aureimonas ureilytica TaxID=401562 RepID=UPI00036D7000|nr:ubiquinol-cytochrome C chaperone family protein [Aureimonas ureilytica]